MRIREKIILSAARWLGHDFDAVGHRRGIGDQGALSADELKWRFKAIIDYARANVPYYDAKYRKTPLDIDALSRGEWVPGSDMTKNEILKNRIAVKKIQPVVALESGGTTGKRVETAIDGKYLLERYGSLLQILYGLSWTMGDSIVALHPREYLLSRHLKKMEYKKFVFEALQQEILYRWFHGRSNVYYKASDFTQNNSRHFMQQLRRRHPFLLISRPDILLTLLRQAVLAQEDIPQVPAVLCVGNVFTAGLKDEIERVLKTKAYNMYASTELGYVGLSCAHSKEWVHVDEMNYFVEIDPANGEILVTDFRNHAMPFIRYRTGDVGVIKREACACQRRGRLLKVLGRVNKVVVNDRGEKIFESHVIEAMRAFPGVFCFQMNCRAGDKQVLIPKGLSSQDVDGLAVALRRNLGVGNLMIAEAKHGMYQFSDSGKFPYICS